MEFTILTSWDKKLCRSNRRVAVSSYFIKISQCLLFGFQKVLLTGLSFSIRVMIIVTSVEISCKKERINKLHILVIIARTILLTNKIPTKTIGLLFCARAHTERDRIQYTYGKHADTQTHAVALLRSCNATRR